MMDYSEKVKPTVIGVVADFCCCSNASMMASTESLNRPVASPLEDIKSDNQWRWRRSNEVLPRQLQLPKCDAIFRISGAAPGNPDISRFLITLDDEFR